MARSSMRADAGRHRRGVITLGDTPISQAAPALGIAEGAGRGFDTGGLLSRHVGFLTVAEGRARHVLV